MPAERAERRRQNPVACQNCRTRKLKCDLRQPCSSCSSRHWTCEFATRQDAVACTMCRQRKIKCDRGHPCSSCHLKQWKCEYSLSCCNPPRNEHHASGEAVMLARILRLEQAVFAQQPQQSPSKNHANKEQTLPLDPWPEAGEQQEIVSTSGQLEDICSGLEDGTPHLKEDLCIEQKTLAQLAAESVDLRETKRISLPPRDFALRVLDVYEQTLEPALQIMHVPSFRVKVNSLYEPATRPEPSSNSGLVALILAMSSQIGFWDNLKWHGLFENANVAVKVSTRLAEQAMDALDHARDLCIITVENIQAAVVLVFVFLHMEGFSTRARVLHSMALTMARELGLHRIDAKSLDPMGASQEALIDIETRRKLWWYMVGTDWILAFNSGPNEGVYTILPKQMKVKKPRNLSATDLTTQGHDFDRPTSEPTKMAYYFFRLDLADICREAVDSGLTEGPDTVCYEKVYQLDGKFHTLMTSLPRFLKLDVDPDIIKHEYGECLESQIGLQRALTNLMGSLRRCKFHLPFLTRYKEDRRYSFSRNACLEAAEKLLEVRRVFLDDSNWHTSSYLELLCIYRYVYYATMVFVIDLCINNLNESVQLDRVREALTVVADAASTSRTASKLLIALREVLQKHGISLPFEAQESKVVKEPQPQSSPLPVSDQHHVAHESVLTESMASNASFDFSNFELLWPDNLANDQFVDPNCWDKLINLDMRLF